ncbi:uncharacterized protein LOC143255900 isoform X3 [Tachypleus tridentatus]|uniref:uncharacterized protein LOC143255900 isoform X3 n=1 Tax=Tachypleus tridentatus TaxID=6853 RepID=UPI003FD06448
MFGVDGNSEVQIEGQIIRVPKLTGNNGKYETFSSTTFYFTKPSWEPDSCATSCNLCETRFTQLKRKHHCRNCGKIFCAKCCKNKIPLPHFGLDESQRVCDLCRSTAELVGLSRSQYVSHRQDAAKGLADMMETPAEMGKMIEAGGVHILISLTSQGDNKIKKTVAKSLHRISHHIELHDFMMEIGAIKALLHILSSVTPNQEDTLADCLGSLLLFFHNSDYKMKALKEGALDTFVRLLNTPGVLALLAARALSLLVDMPEAQTLITQSSPSVLSRLFMTFKVKNNEMQNVILKTLETLSLSSEELRHLVIREEQAAGRPILFLLKSGYEQDDQILLNTVNIVGNLAISASDQVTFQVSG